MNARQLRRLLTLMNLLEARIGHTVHELAQECQVSTRTIYRDLNLLTEAGVHVRYDADARGHVTFWEYPSATLRGFTWEELTVLVLAARTSCLRPMGAVRGAVERSVGRILARMSPEKREGTVRLLQSCVVDLPFVAVEEHVFSAISSAIRDNCQIRITFLSSGPDGPLAQTKVAPYRLVVSSQGWELIGRSSLHRQTRRFNFSEILAVETAEDPIPCRPFRIRRRRDAASSIKDNSAPRNSAELPLLIAAGTADQVAEY